MAATQQVNLRMTPAEAEDLRTLAHRDGISASEYMRKLVQDAVRRRSLEQDIAVLRRHRAEHGTADPELEEFAELQASVVDELDRS